MAESHVVSNLAAKRAELAGQPASSPWPLVQSDTACELEPPSGEPLRCFLAHGCIGGSYSCFYSDHNYSKTHASPFPYFLMALEDQHPAQCPSVIAPYAGFQAQRLASLYD